MQAVFRILTVASAAGFAFAALVNLSSWFFVPPAALVQGLVICAVALFLPAGVVSRQIALKLPLERAFTAQAQGWARPLTILVYVAFANASLHLFGMIAGSIGSETHVANDDIRVQRLLLAFMASFYAIAWAIWDSCRRRPLR